MADAWDQFPDAPAQGQPQAAGADPWAQFPDAPQAAQPAPQMTQGQEWTEAAKNVGSAIVRPIAKGVAALPLMAMDAGVASRNLIGNVVNKATGQPATPNYDLPSTMFNASLDEFTRAPQGLANQGAEMVSSALVGSRVPAPQAAQQAPRGFTPPAPELTPAQETFKAGREAGYVAPPGSVKTNPVTHLLESLGGKAATQQVASAKNQSVTNALVRDELGIPKNAAITPQVLNRLRNTAGSVYAEVSKAGGIVKTDTQYADEIGSLLKKSADIAEDFPDANVASGAEVEKLVQSLTREQFKTSSALAYLKELRKQASSNLSFVNSADPAKKALGLAQREAAGALEDMVMRNLQAQGRGDLAQKFDGARRLIAKTYSVENALNPSTGNVAARQLATQLRKGKPISGKLKIAADFAGAFPKATEELRHSGSVSALDALVAAGGAATVHPAALAWPAARFGARQFLLSSPVQNALLQPQQANALSRAPYAMGAIPFANEELPQ